MTALKWLTPDDPPDGTKCIALWLPDGDGYEAAARGALSPLCCAENWEQIGSETPEDVSQAFREAFSATFAWLPCSGMPFMQYVHVVDEKSAGTGGGSYDPEDGFIVRDLTQIYHDGTDDVTLANNKIGIPAGKYTALVSVPFVTLGKVATYLYIQPQVPGDFTAFALYGTSERARPDYGSGHGHIHGYFEVSHPAYLRVYMRASNEQEADWGLGMDNSFLTKERYTSVELWKWLTGSP